MRRPPLVLLVAAAVALFASPAHGFELVPLDGDYAQPVHVSGPPDDATRVLVVEKGGTIRLVKNGVQAATPYLDLTDRVDTDDEEGMLSMAFASPDRFYVLFNEDTGTAGSDIVVEAYDVAPGRDAADPGSAEKIITIGHRAGDNHNGGQIHVGPDGNLWISTGDGGGAQFLRDSDGDAQDPYRLLGKLLRIAPRADGGHDVPPDNPYAARGGGAPEVWALGLRNPWRFSFDRGTGDLWLGDVGEGWMEEVDHAAAPALGCGANFGWPYYEGDRGTGWGAKPGSHQPPLFVLPRTAQGGEQGWRAIAGGYVIRDPALAEAGQYVHGDYFVSTLWLYDPETGARTETDAEVNDLTGFGEDGVGRVYATSFDDGGKVDLLAPDGGVPAQAGVAPPLATVVPPGCDPPPGPIAEERTDEQAPPQDDPPLDAPGLPLGDPVVTPLPQAPRLTATARRRQRALRGRRVVVRARCDVACRATLTGRLTIGPRQVPLTGAIVQLAPGRTRRLVARLGPRAARVARRALRRRARVRALLTVRARDAAGREARPRGLTVTIVR